MSPLLWIPGAARRALLVLGAMPLIVTIARADGPPPASPPTASAPTTVPASRPATFPPQPVAAGERADERKKMVEIGMVHPLDDRQPVTAKAVLEAMRAVPRHVFVPGPQREFAYVDAPLPIGEGQTISQPYIVAIMTELLELTPEAKVLEIGTGSGYQAAVLAHLTPHVYTIEIVKPLADRATALLAEQGYNALHVRCGDGHAGWPEEAPFDGIIVTCAADEVPPALWEQLKVGGRMVIPVGPAGAVQELIVLTKGAKGERQTKTVMPVRFVPMTTERKP